MAYNASYAEGDIATSVISTIVKAVITFGTLITVVVVIFMYAWVRKNL